MSARRWWMTFGAGAAFGATLVLCWWAAVLGLLVGFVWVLAAAAGKADLWEGDWP